MSEPAERISPYGANTSFSQSVPFATRANDAEKAGDKKTGQAGFAKQLGEQTSQSPVADSLQLSPEAQEQLRKLQQRDAEVRTHEAAHLAAAGQYAVGGAHYEYQKGPDGRQYAIGGHVDIDTSPVPGDAEATERKAEQVRRAAMAPGAPSAQDSKVAASAAHMSAEAKNETQKDEREDAEVSGNKEAQRASRAYALAGNYFSGADTFGKSGVTHPTRETPVATTSMTHGLAVYANAAQSGMDFSATTAPRGNALAMAV